MAIIICNSCGKKVSDTVDVCIHCGQNPKEETVKTDERASAEETSKAVTIDFNKLSDEEKKKLEIEFLKEDNWSKKYMRNRFELLSYAKPIFFYPILLFIIFRLLSTFTDIFIGADVVNKGATVIAAVSGIGLTVVCCAMFVYSILKRIYNFVTHARYIYYRRLQKWLNEKNIYFFPELQTLRQKALFESIIIE